jgi:hypothetical protein
MNGRLEILAAAMLALECLAVSVRAAPAPPPATNAAPLVNPPPAFSPRAHKFRALDADNHSILLNRPGFITLVIGTNEDTQDAARAAGKAVYPFQGRPDFALIVVVDLRNSIAGWVPSMVTSRMRVSLDQEADELKPWFLKNGNKSNPRLWSHVVPDFSGTVCPQLNWKEGADSLRAIIFGVDGREIDRLDKVEDMSVLQDHVRAAIQAQIDLEQARVAEAAKTPGSKDLHPVYRHPPIISYTPAPKQGD